MPKELKSIRVLEFSGKTTDWEGWSEKFLARGKRAGYKHLLTGKETIPTVEQYDTAVGKGDAESKKIVDLANKNEEAFEDIILSIDHTTTEGKVAFSLVKNCRTASYPEGSCKLAWERLLAKYAPKTAPSLLKLKKKFANSKLGSEHPDEWITELESLRNDMDKISLTAKMTDQDFMIHVLNNLTEEYDVILDGMESKLMLGESDPSRLTIEEIRSKLNNRYERIEDRDEQAKREVAFAEFVKQYKGTCTKCGKYGHKSADCTEKSSRGTKGEDKRKCWNCGEIGHIKSDCPKLKKPSEVAQSAVDYESDNTEDYLSDYSGVGF